MPTVPMLNGPRAESAPLPRVQTPLEAFGGGAANYATDLTPVARIAMEIHREETQKADQIAVTEAAGKFTALETKLKMAAVPRRGKNALTLPEEMQSEYKKEADAIVAGAKTQDQKIRFEQLSQQHWAELDYAIQSHVAKEREVYDAETTASTLQSQFEATVANWQDPRRVDMGIGDQVAVLKGHAERLGWSKDTYDNEEKKLLSRNRAAVINEMLSQKQIPAAAAYFDAHSQDLTAAVRSDIEKVVKASTYDQIGMDAAGAVWASDGPPDNKAPVLIKKMEDKLRAQFAGQPDILKIALQDLEHRANIHEKQVAEINSANVNSVMEAFNANDGISISSLKSLQSFRDLEPTKQNELTKYVISSQRSGRIAHEQDLELRGASRMFDLMDPQWLSKHTVSDIKALVPQIGVRNATALMNDWLQLDKATKAGEDKVRTVTIDREVFETLANKRGIYNTKDDKHASEVWGQTYLAVKLAIDERQQAENRPLTETEKTEEMNRILGIRVMLDYNTVRSDKEVLLTAVTPDDGIAYMPWARIPMRERQALVNRIKAERGVNLPPDTIVKRYQRTIERMWVAIARGDAAKLQMLIDSVPLGGAKPASPGPGTAYDRQ